MPDLVVIQVEHVKAQLARRHVGDIIARFAKEGVVLKENMPLLVAIKTDAGTTATLLEHYLPKVKESRRADFSSSFENLTMTYRNHRQHMLDRLNALANELRDKTLGLIVEAKLDANNQLHIEFRMPDGRTLGTHSAKDLEESTTRGKILDKVQLEKEKLALLPAPEPSATPTLERNRAMSAGSAEQIVNQTSTHSLGQPPAPRPDNNNGRRTETADQMDEANLKAHKEKVAASEAAVKRANEEEAARQEAGPAFRPKGAGGYLR